MGGKGNITRSLPTNQFLAALKANNPSKTNVFVTMIDLTTSIGGLTLDEVLKNGNRAISKPISISRNNKLGFGDDADKNNPVTYAALDDQNNLNLYVDNGLVQFLNNAFYVGDSQTDNHSKIQGTFTAARVQILPDKSGTFAMLSDIQSTVTASNGLNEDGDDIQQGGDLLKDTTIDTQTFDYMDVKGSGDSIAKRGFIDTGYLGFANNSNSPISNLNPIFIQGYAEGNGTTTNLIQDLNFTLPAGSLSNLAGRFLGKYKDIVIIDSDDAGVLRTSLTSAYNETYQARTLNTDYNNLTHSSTTNTSLRSELGLFQGIPYVVNNVELDPTQKGMYYGTKVDNGDGFVFVKEDYSTAWEDGVIITTPDSVLASKGYIDRHNAFTMSVGRRGNLNLGNYMRTSANINMSGTNGAVVGAKSLLVGISVKIQNNNSPGDDYTIKVTVLNVDGSEKRISYNIINEVGTPYTRVFTGTSKTLVQMGEMITVQFVQFGIPSPTVTTLRNAEVSLNFQKIQ